MQYTPLLLLPLALLPAFSLHALCGAGVSLGVWALVGMICPVFRDKMPQLVWKCWLLAAFLVEISRLVKALPFIGMQMPPVFAVILLLGAVWGFGASCGKTALARSVSLLGVIWIAAILLLLAGRAMQPLTVSPPAESGDFWWFTGIEIPFLMLSAKRENLHRCVLRVTLLKAAGLLGIFLLLTTGGTLVQSSPYPIFLLAKLTQPLAFRVDAVYLTAFLTAWGILGAQAAACLFGERLSTARA
ncbi:MAG: hypothetical protein II916_03100 [Oscillospiraceae bacterium]|nr:hypothetical protein [Oscillospiraceae bacterium]